MAVVAALIVGLLLSAVPAFADAGNLDRSFDKDGRVTTDLGGYDIVTGLALQPDGKIVAAGDSNGAFGNNTTGLALARYNQDGTLDRSFGEKGRVTTNFGNDKETFGASLVLKPNGRIVAAGGTLFRASDADLALARYTTE
jgi:uncharacterized delta-60 repeat protein